MSTSPENRLRSCYTTTFEPLGMRATFVRRGEYTDDQPRAHYEQDEVLRYPWYERRARPLPLLEASELAMSLPDFVTFLQAHLCAAQGRANALLTQAEALRIYGETETGARTPLGWSMMNVPGDPIRILPGHSGGFSGAGGFSKLTGRGAAMLLNVDGLYAAYATGWVWNQLSGYDGSFPRTRRQVPRAWPE